MKRWVEKIFQYGCYIFFLISIVYLALLSMFSTSSIELKRVISEGEPERVENYNYFLPDSPWRHLLACGILLVVLCVVFSFWNSRKKKISLQWLCIPFFVFCILFIIQADLYPVSDSNKILTVARQIREHNYEQFAMEGYMHRYPDQTGIVLIYYWIHGIFGEKDYLAIQIWNAVCLAGTYFFLGRIAFLLWGDKDKNVQDMTLLFCIAFFPMALYVTLVYGMIPGLAFGVLAFYLQLKYMKSGRLIYGAGAAAAASIAVVWKTNSLIMLIAMCIFLVYDCIAGDKGRKKKSLAVILLLFLLYAAGAWAVNTAAEKLTGIEVSEGMPKTAWIGMGLQEAASAPGVYNGYSVGTYEENNYDYDRTDAAAKEEIKNRLMLFWEDKSYGVDFFGRKNAAQWNDPAFSSLAVIAGREETGGIDLDNLCHGPLKDKTAGIANYLHTAILAGVCFYLFFHRKKRESGELLLGIAVVGGLLFHMFWEAKPQYTLPYFVLLLPYCAAGYSGMVQRMLVLWKERKRNDGKTKERCLTAVIGIGITAAFIGIISLLSGFRIISYTVSVRNEPERLLQYEEAVKERLEEYEERQE